MTWLDLIDALLAQPPHRQVVVRFYELRNDGLVVDWKGSIPIHSIEPDRDGNTVIYLAQAIPKPPQWTKIPPWPAPDALVNLICDKTLVSPIQFRRVWDHIYDHYSSFDDVPL